MTPTTGEGPIHYHIGTPDTRHSPMASSEGMRCDPLLVSRITGLEESVSKLFDVVNGQGRKSEEMLAQMDSMHREFPKLSMTMAAIKAQIQEERTRRTRMVDEVKRAKSHWNQGLEKALRTQEATLKAEERMGKLSEKVIGELASTAKSLGGKIENLEHEMGKRDEDRLTAIQTVKSELIEAPRRNERRTNHALDELAVKMKEFRKELDEQHKEDNATLGKYREAIRIMNTKVDRIIAQSEREVAVLKKEIDEQRKSTARLKIMVDDSVGGLWKNIRMLQGEFGYEVEAIRKDLGKSVTKTGNSRTWSRGSRYWKRGMLIGGLSTNAG